MSYGLGGPLKSMPARLDFAPIAKRFLREPGVATVLLLMESPPPLRPSGELFRVALASGFSWAAAAAAA